MHLPKIPRVARHVGFALLGLTALTAVGFGAEQLQAAKPTSFFSDLLKAYQPREFCMLYEPVVIWLHLVSDALIALAYYSIPVALIYFTRRRSDLTFSWMFVCFAVFILACGTTHVMNIVAIWYAPYRLDALIKVVTAGVSVATAILLWPLIPKALALPSPAALRLANAELEREVDVRREAEQSLQRMQSDLERRVAERTAELRASNEKLHAEAAMRTAAEKEREHLLQREREARTEAERANRSKDEFLATLSHELRTPLGAISGWVHLLREEHGHLPDLAEGLTVIERNTRMQARLIEELLDMSRIIAGKLRLDVQQVDLSRVIDAAVETVAPSAASKGVQLQKILDPLAAQVTGDPARLQQVVWNLLSNAIKFTPSGGRVQIALERVNSHLEISVSDTGMGIAPEFLPHIFERFRQADSSTTRAHGGLGIGLALVRHLAELHGGSVRAKSPGEGRGAVFSVHLPVRAVRHEDSRIHPAAPDPARLPSARQLRLEGVTVLIVDDEADSREILRRIIQQSGGTVSVARNAAEGLVSVRTLRPSVIISDIGMPGEDGYEFLRKVRALSPGEGGLTPAVALTAFARPEDRVRALVAGFQMHLSKPADPSEMILVLNSLVAGAGRPPASGTT